MATVKPNALLTRISGKLSKKEDMVFYWKFGKNFVWRNEGYHGPYSAAQLAAQAIFTQAAAKLTARMSDATQKASYMPGFKAQTVYKTFTGYLMAICVAQTKNESN